jgi:acyl-CoA synthetase (AMP-forming)/AMP-acid ligase II
MVDLLERERVSSCFFVPSQWAAIIAVPGLAERDLSALRRCSWGAAPASTTLLRAMIDAFPQADIVTAFGQTECSPVTCPLRGEDAIRKIAEVALIGVPDTKYGEAPLAVVVARDPADPPTAADVETFCRERLATYKRPRDHVLVDALPRNPSGKVLKTRLRTTVPTTLPLTR